MFHFRKIIFILYFVNLKIYKEETEAYSENTDEPIRKSFNIYVKLALHVVNLLPIPIECSIDVCLILFIF
jgi:hypothetical protein